MDLQGLNQIMGEYNRLSVLLTPTKQQIRRMEFLQSAAAAVKSGATLQEFEQRNLNDYERTNGLDVTRFNADGLTPEQRNIAKAWQAAATEKRDNGGNPLNRLGTYTGLGQFVPTEFFGSVISQLKQVDPLFNEEDCTVINATNARVTTIPTVGDIEAVASVLGESASDSETDITHPGQAVLGCYTYRTPRWDCSLEAFQDLSTTIDAMSLFTDFASSRFRRGIGAHLVNGDGSNKPLGLIPSLEALASSATPFITASGSAANTGGAESGATSIGSADIAALYYSVDAAYRANPKTAFLMADSTLQYLDGLVTKYGQPLNLVKWDDGEPFIFGKPVKISPTVPALGSSNVVCLFGDLSYWVTKIVTGIGGNGTPLGYVQSYTEGPGMIENGLVGFRAFLRAGGVLAVQDSASPSPINYLRCHS